jgi:hypothetical protein
MGLSSCSRHLICSDEPVYVTMNSSRIEAHIAVNFEMKQANVGVKSE